MQAEYPSREELLAQVAALNQELEAANEEKADLEILLETITEHSTELENQIHQKNKDMLSYIQQVEQFTAAAVAVENDTFQPESLSNIAARADELGHLARVFRQMVHTVKTREYELETCLRRYSQALGELARNLTEDLETALKQCMRAASRTLGVERTSVWLYNPEQTQIECFCLYERTRDRTSKGSVLTVSGFPNYFRALSAQRLIAAHDAHTDPATCEFSEAYLTPLGITSMLEVPIFISGKMVGVVCHEHIGHARQWQLEEQIFAGSIGDFVALSLETHRLAEAKGQLEAVLDAVPGSIAWIRSDGVYIGVNQRMASSFNLTPQAFEGQRMGWLRGSTPLTDFVYQFLTSPEEVASQVVPVEVGGESKRYYLVIAQKYQQGTATVSVGIDVTEQKQAEEALQQSEARNRAFLDAIPDLMFRIHRNGTYLDYKADRVNDLPFDPATVLGKTVYEVLPLDVAQQRMYYVERALQTGEMQEFTYQLTSKHGTLRDYEARLVVSGEDEVLAIVRDITERQAALRERQRAEEALRQSEATNRALIAAIPDLLLRVRGDGTYISDAIGTNRLRRFIGGIHSIANTSVYDSLPNEQANQRMHYIQQALKTGELQIYEQQLINNDQLIDEEVRIVVTGEDEVLIIVRDITEQQAALRERKRAEEALRMANEDLERRVEARTAELRLEKERSEQLLLNVLPKSIAERLKESREAPAEHFDEATILFADIVGFTALSTRMDPLKLVNLLNQIFSAFDHLAEKYDLEKIKTIGDAYMVVGGLPVLRPDHAEAIANMALEMQACMTNFRNGSGESFQIRIGINTGPVIAGVIGIKKFIYDLWGDAVNIASRMESHGNPGSIQVTNATYERLKNQYVFQKRGTIAVKGKGNMTTYWLLGKV